MQFWQALPFTHPDDLLELAPVCEEAGFEGIMLADHLFSPEEYVSQYPYADSGEAPFDGSTPFPESFATISALAQVTTKLRFITNVYILPLRHPIEIAKDLRLRATRGPYRAGAASTPFHRVAPAAQANTQARAALSRLALARWPASWASIS